ncbi:epithelial splicing regulatory protein [Xylographa pallens]|nr:epithelial splicing regulatory protein [Xylographa pallens]
MSRPYDNSNPPAYPPQAHYDAGPAFPIASPAPSPYNAYGGFAHPAADPRSGPQYPGSPAPNGQYGPPQPYYGNNNNNNGGGPMAVGPGYGQPQGMYYGQPQQQQYMYGGPPGGGGYGGYGGQGGGYYDQRGHGGGAGEGICAGLVGALACCCCLDFLI